MEEELARLRRQLADSEEKRRPLNLAEYLESCHDLKLSSESITERTLTTQGETTDPTGRLYPRRIIPWVGFSTEQEKIWHQLNSSSLASSNLFPSRDNMEYEKGNLKSISSESTLVGEERKTLATPVEKIMRATYADVALRRRLGLHGSVSFEDHTNLGDRKSRSTSMEGGASEPTRAQGQQPGRRRHGRGKGNAADQFCICETSDNQKFPAVAIEYKAPHKLTSDEVATGLQEEIQPDRDVINKEGTGPEFAAKRLTAAVVTQLFSYMVGKGIRHGYVSTGQAYIFTHIMDDPTCVYYHVSIPGEDVVDDDENRLHRTAVAQVYAFIIQAIQAPPLSQQWQDGTSLLDKWAVEYDDVLRSIPETDRRGKRKRETPYKATCWKGFKRSPIRTRSGCAPPDDGTHRSSDDSNDDDSDSPSPMPPRIGRGTGIQGSDASRADEQGGSSGGRQGSNKRQYIRDRPYCTQECLRGASLGGPMDKKCPNADDHGEAHIERSEFLWRIRHQLAVDRGDDADCMPLYMTGSRGSLFKLRLSSHGYTLVAKGVEEMDKKALSHEKDVYDHVEQLQGTYVPVCLGLIDLIKPYYFDCGVYVHFLLMSYSGRPVLYEMDRVMPAVTTQIMEALGRLHRCRVLHKDAEPRNVLYDKKTGRCMIVDLMLSEIVPAREPLGAIGSANKQSRGRKRKNGAWEREGSDEFAAELDKLRAHLVRAQ